MNIISICGTRPQWMKLDVNLPQKIVVSGQHFSKNMKNVFFKDLKLPKPDYDCGSTDLVGMIAKMRMILKKEQPSCVLVYGDTRTTLAGAIAASDLNLPIAHVESGMRCWRPDMPEERIRIIVDHLSSILFAPTFSCVANLENEKLRDNIFLVGNTMFDTMAQFCPIKPSKDFNKYIYLTIHRQENADSKIRLQSIFEGLEGEERIIFPCHPRTKKNIKKFNIGIPHNVQLIDPVSYKENLHLIADCRMVLTDSGGVQNEAYWLGKPCGILRRETEWKEYVADGWAWLLDADPIDIKKFTKIKFNGAQPRNNMPEYGAKNKIREILLSIYG